MQSNVDNVPLSIDILFDASIIAPKIQGMQIPSINSFLLSEKVSATNINVKQNDANQSFQRAGSKSYYFVTTYLHL